MATSHYIRTLLAACAMLAFLVNCGAQQRSAIVTDDFDTWTTDALYGHGISLLKRGVRLNEAIYVLKLSAGRDYTNHEYQLALGCAYASRFASVACALRNLDTFAREKERYERRQKQWADAQEDPANASYRTAAPQAPTAPTTPDDGKLFTTDRRATQLLLFGLGQKSIAAFMEAHKLTEIAAPKDRASTEFVRGWGLFLLRRFGIDLVQPPPYSALRTATAEAAKEQSALAITDEDVRDCFRICTELEPKSAGNWHSLALASIPKSIFGAENELQRKYVEGLAISSQKEDLSAIAALKKAIALKPRDFNLLYLLHLSAYAVDPALALQSLERATLRMPNNAALWYCLADRRLKRANVLNQTDGLAQSQQAIDDAQSGNSASQYWAVSLYLPAPAMLRRAWAFIPTYGLAEDHVILQETVFGLGAFVAERDAQADDATVMRAIPVLMAMGLKLLDGMEAADLDPAHPRSQTIRWGRAFTGIMCCYHAYELMRDSQKTRPDERKAAYLTAQKDLIRRLSVLETEVIKAR